MSKQVFISKNAQEIAPIENRLKASGIKFIAQSFLNFHACSFELKQTPDIIFFGSARSVQFLSQQLDLACANDLACIGKKTAALITEMGLNASFVGNSSGYPKAVGEEFKKWCKGRRVLFPASDRSLKTISQLFPTDQKEDVVVYETIISDAKIADCDTYVFSSPSNVEGFLASNRFPEHAEIIAWGKTTKKALAAKGIAVNHTLNHANLEELADYLTRGRSTTKAQGIQS